MMSMYRVRPNTKTISIKSLTTGEIVLQLRSTDILVVRRINDDEEVEWVAVQAADATSEELVQYYASVMQDTK